MSPSLRLLILSLAAENRRVIDHMPYQTPVLEQMFTTPAQTGFAE